MARSAAPNLSTLSDDELMRLHRQSAPASEAPAPQSGQPMQTFELQDPDGGSYEIQAPDEASAVAAFKKLNTVPEQSGPWERYQSGQAQPRGPWERYGGQAAGQGSQPAGKWWEKDELVAPAPRLDEPGLAGVAMAEPATGLRGLFERAGRSAEASAGLPDRASIPAPTGANMMPYGEAVATAVSKLGEGADRGVRMLADGMTFGAANKIAAGAGTGFGYLGDYSNELDRQRIIDAETEAAAPVTSAVVRGAGNLVTAAGLQMAGVPMIGLRSGQVAAGSAGAAEAVAAGGQAVGLGTRVAQAAGANAAVSGIAGAVNEDEDKNKLWSGGREGLVGLVAGMAGPLIGSAFGTGANYVGRVGAGYFNPESYAGQMASRLVQRSGRSADDIANTVAAARAEGTPYTAAEALGTTGQKAVARIAKNPDEARQFAIDTLEQRQAGQARRVQNALVEGFNAPQTAEQTQAALTTARGAAADAAYREARRAAGAVDVSPALMRIDQTLRPGAAGQLGLESGLRDDTIEGALRQARAMLGNGRDQVTDFDVVHRAKSQLDDVARKAARAGEDNRARLIGAVARDLDDSLAAASRPYAAARDRYAAGSRQIEAVDAGRNAATRGRTEDVLPRFQALSPEEQAAFRPGFVDPYIAKIQKTPLGGNAARPLTSDAVRTEFPAIAAPGQDARLMRRIAQENDMYATYAGARGGSPTAELLAEEGGMAPGGRAALADALSANLPGLARRAIDGVANIVTGSTEQGRAALVRVLLSGDPDALRMTLQEQARRSALVDALSQNAGRTVSGGSALLYRDNRKRNQDRSRQR